MLGSATTSLCCGTATATESAGSASWSRCTTSASCLRLRRSSHRFGWNQPLPSQPNLGEFLGKFQVPGSWIGEALVTMQASHVSGSLMQFTSAQATYGAM